MNIYLKIVKGGFSFLLIFCCSIITNAQNQKVAGIPVDLIKFFEGTWTGSGEFSNGKKIQANLSFKLSLDSSWIKYEHNDIAPNRYQAFSMWGVDKEGQFQAYSFDNFKGHRSFKTDGWVDNELILTNTQHSSKGSYQEHFIYKKLDDRSFKMTYEVSRDGINWNMVDYLIFTKN